MDFTSISDAFQLLFGFIVAVATVAGAAVPLSSSARASALIERLTASVAAMPPGHVREALVLRRDRKVWEWESSEDLSIRSAARSMWAAVGLAYVFGLTWAAAVLVTTGADWTWAFWGAALVSLTVSAARVKSLKKTRKAWVCEKLDRDRQPTSGDELELLFTNTNSPA